MFSKSKRFSYSEIPATPAEVKSPNDSRSGRSSRVGKVKKMTLDPKNIKDSLETIPLRHSAEKKTVSYKKDEVKRGLQRKVKDSLISKTKMENENNIKENRLSQFIISNESNNHNNPLKTIVKCVKNTVDQAFTRNVYNVRKEEQKQFKYINSKDPNHTFTYDDFKQEFSIIKQMQDDLMKVTSDDKNDDFFVTNNTINKAFHDIEDVVVTTNAGINDILQESLLKISDNSNKRFKGFLAEITAYNIMAIEEIQASCAKSIEEMDKKVKEILKTNTEKLICREIEMKKTNDRLKAELITFELKARKLEEKYMILLDNAEKRILSQELINSILKAEINAMELNTSMEKVINKQKTK